MEPIHFLSPATPLPNFDLFGVPPTQETILEDIVTEHRPISQQLKNTNFFQFEILTAIDEYVNFDDTELYVKLEFTETHDDKITSPWKLISPVTNLLQSMIRQIDVFIGDNLVTSSPQTYAYRAYFETFLGHSKEAKKTHLTSQFWYDDQDEKKDEVNTKFTKIISSDGNKSNIIDMMGRLHLDLGFQDRVLLGGCKIKIHILLNDPAFYLMAKEGINPGIDIKEMILFVRRSKVIPSIVQAHNLALEKAPAKYPICHSRVKPFTLNRGQFDAHIDIHNGILPRRILIAFITNEAFVGSLQKYPFKFDHFDIAMLSTHLNGKQLPYRPFTPDFDNNIFIREMKNLFITYNQNGNEITIPVTRDNYDKGNILFAFNFADDKSSGCISTGHANPLKFGTLKVEVRFKEELKQTTTMLVYCEFDKILEIDLLRNGRIEFS